MSSDVLSVAALNRALLERQMLLRRVPLPPAGSGGGASNAARLPGQAAVGGAGEAGGGPPDRAERVIEAIERLAGLQAQAPFPPYYGLWSRLAGFRPDDLAELIVSRRVVRIALMRGTIHLVSARDCLLMRAAVQPALERWLAAAYGKRLAGLDTGALAAAGRAAMEQRPRTFAELGALLAQRWPDRDPAALAQAVRSLVPLVQVPPRAVWGAAGPSAHTSAEAWLGCPLGGTPRLDELVVRYLAAFGPATVRDVQAWSGLTRLREVVERLRPGLRTLRDERGAELFDLPDAPRPDPRTPAPVRLVAEFDNLLLSHADRTRVISEPHRQRLFTRNGIVPGTVLVDGFVRGMWRITRSRAAVRLLIELFEPVRPADRGAITGEGEAMLAFAAPDALHRDIRFAPIA